MRGERRRQDRQGPKDLDFQVDHHAGAVQNNQVKSLDVVSKTTNRPMMCGEYQCIVGTFGRKQRTGSHFMPACFFGIPVGEPGED